MELHAKKLLSTLAATATFAIALCSSAYSAIVVTPVSATSSTTIGAPRDINAAISGLGLTDGGDPTSVLDDIHGGGGSSNHFLSNAYSPAGNVVNEVLTFDLQGATSDTFDIDTIYLWAYNRAEAARGIITFDIAFSTDGGSSFGSAVTAASLGMTDFTLGTTNQSTTSTVQTRSITTQTGVTDIRLSNITNGGQDRIALAEIRFGAVPEPSSALLGGLGTLLLLRRRRAS